MDTERDTATEPVEVGFEDLRHDAGVLDWAAADAVARGVPLRIVHAWHQTAAMLPWDSSVDRSIRRDLHDRARRALNDAVSHVRAGWPDLPLQPELVETPPTQAIGRSRHTPVTVVGTRFHHGLSAALMGSVSTGVLAHAVNPVVVVRGDAGQHHARPEVVVGVDGLSGTAEQVLDFAVAHAARHRLAVRVLYCDRTLGAVPPDRRRRAGLWLAELAGRAGDRAAGVRITDEIDVHDPAHGLLDAARGSALLVVGTRSRHPDVALVLGSVTQAALHHAPCPVAAVPGHHRCASECDPEEDST
ncbi:MAG: universal stress protein [Williamsia herbipolensis]|nr:universal stress protein [Williamsia herbipolensis]